MDALQLVAIAKIACCSVILVMASVADWRTREISDKLWVALGASGGLLTGVELLLSFSVTRLLVLVVSALVCLALGFGLYYVGFFGGADAKCLWCLGVAVPFNPMSTLNFRCAGVENPIFSLSVFSNSVLTAALIALAIVVFNAMQSARKPIFRGLEGESSWRKALAMMLGYRMKVSRALEKKDFYFPLEEIEVEEGSVKRRFKLLTRCLDDDPFAGLKELVEKGYVNVDEEVWVSPAIPLLINITVGFFIALLYGDLVLSAVSYAFGFNIVS